MLKVMTQHIGIENRYTPGTMRCLGRHPGMPVTQPAGLPPDMPLVNIGNRLVQQCFDIALAFALAYVAERTAWRLQSLDPVEAEQFVGYGVWGESREKTLQHGLNQIYK